MMICDDQANRTCLRTAKHRIVLFFAALLLFCAGCSDETPTIKDSEDYSYAAEAVTYSEPGGQYSFSRDMQYTESEKCKYYFENDISAEQRAVCINATERIMAEFDNAHSIVEIYIFKEDTYDGVFVDGNRLYLTAQDYLTVDYATNVVIAACGAYTHYGLAFGYANNLCCDFGWISEQEISFSAPMQTDTLDLNLLCFSAEFSTECDILAAQNVARAFVNDLISQGGVNAVQDLLADSNTASGMELVKEKLSDFYLKNGITFLPSVLRFGFGGVTSDYIVDSDMGQFIVGENWKDSNLDYNPTISENLLHEDYSAVKAFFETNIWQMEQYQSLFDLEGYNNDLAIIFPNRRSASQYSYYQKGFHRIYVMNIDSLMHEYIHAITQPTTSMSSWETEGFARYFSYRHDKYGIDFLNYDYNNTVQSAATQYVHEFLETISRPIDMSVDYKEIENIAVYSRSYQNPNSSYVAGSSFVQFLVQKYGEKAVVDSIYGSGTPLPEPYDDLVNEWNEYISENYVEYSKYK